MKYAVIVLRTNTELKARIEELAHQDGRSVNNYLIRLIVDKVGQKSEVKEK